MSLRLRPLRHAVAPAWDRFVAAHPLGTFFHRAAWSTILAQSFGHAEHSVLAEQDGCITGVLPLMAVRSRLFGDRLVSTPFLSYGGVLAVDWQTAFTLESFADSRRESLGLPILELRNREPRYGSRAALAPWYDRADRYATFRKPMPSFRAIPRKQRATINKARQNRLNARISRSTETFYPPYAENLRNLGTPAFPRHYFDRLLAVFPNDSDCVTVFDGEKPLAAALNFYFRDEVTPYYPGGTRGARRLAGNALLFWTVMEHATKRGAALFDFGRSKPGTGSYAFKEHWGFDPAPMPYRYRLASGEVLPDVSPRNPRYALSITAWKHLPLWLANRTGPWLVPGLG